MYKSFKIILNPNPNQMETLQKQCDATRFVWNKLLEYNSILYSYHKKFAFYNEMSKLLPHLKEEHPWLKEVYSQSLQQKCIDLDKAIKLKYKNKNKKAGFPKFKKKYDNNSSFRVVQKFKLSNKKVYIPKIGYIKWKPHRKFEGKVKSITVKKEVDKWYAFVLCKIEDVSKIKQFKENEIIGLDLGVKDFVVLSDGTKISNPKYYEKNEEKLKNIQRKYSKKKRGSNNQRKLKNRLQKIHLKIKNQRSDFQWKTANLITKNCTVVCVEDLNVSGMLKNRKLSKSISSVSWYSFKERLEYKLKQKGGMMLFVDRFYPSSKLCNNCGFKNKDLELSDRIWVCDNCNVKHDRDLNAAKNIRDFGLKKIKDLSRVYRSRIDACEDTSDGKSELKNLDFSYVSLKQENLVVGLEINANLGV